MDEKTYALKAARHHSRLLRQHHHERDQAIRVARVAGATLREIAEAARLSPTSVKRITDRGP